jgi:hypothetical protein
VGQSFRSFVDPLGKSLKSSLDALFTDAGIRKPNKSIIFAREWSTEVVSSAERHSCFVERCGRELANICVADTLHCLCHPGEEIKSCFRNCELDTGYVGETSRSCVSSTPQLFKQCE